MRQRIGRILLSSCAVAAVALASPVAADAAKRHSHHSSNVQRRATNSAGSTSGSSSTTGSGETPLTGTALQQASSAALTAVPGGTVDSATTENDATGAYEVHVTKSDGSRVKVIEDASFSVLSVTAGGNCG
jgi:uncharacterized membrane protein YkoI